MSVTDSGLTTSEVKSDGIPTAKYKKVLYDKWDTRVQKYTSTGR